MIYALLGSFLGLIGAGIALLSGASVLTALAVHLGIGFGCTAIGFVLAALCLWRNPGQDDVLLAEANR